MDDFAPTRLTYWYNRAERAWVLTLLDASGWDGGESIYVGSGKVDAMAEVARLEEQYGIKAERI